MLMKYLPGSKVVAVSNYNKIPYFTIGRTYQITVVDHQDGTYYFMGDAGFSVQCDRIVFETSTAHDVVVRREHVCTCGGLAVGVTDISRHPEYCDLKVNPTAPLMRDDWLMRFKR